MRSIEYDRLRRSEDDHWWYIVLRWLVHRELEARLPHGARVLDAGCGTGGMLSRLHAWDAWGVDISPQAISHCTQRGLAKVEHASVMALPYEDNLFDAVLSLDVLYHMAVDELRAMTEMARVLRPGGLMLVNMPAFECLRGPHDVAVCGARRYKVCHVRRLLEENTMAVEMIHYWNAWLFVPLLLRRRCGNAGTSDLDMPPRWLNALLAMAGKLDALCCRWLRLPFGSSVFAVARKR